MNEWAVGPLQQTGRQSETHVGQLVEASRAAAQLQDEELDLRAELKRLNSCMNVKSAIVRAKLDSMRPTASPHEITAQQVRAMQQRNRTLDRIVWAIQTSPATPR